VRTSAAGGRCRTTALGMLWLPARTRGSGDKCRGARHASPGEEHAVREREKKGAEMGQRPFIGGLAERKLGGGVRWGVVPRNGRKRGGGPVAATCEQGNGGCRHVGPRPQYRRGAAKFDSIPKFKQIQIIFKFFQDLTNPKVTFLSLKKLK
jgi:hypothetical protein